MGEEEKQQLVEIPETGLQAPPSTGPLSGSLLQGFDSRLSNQEQQTSWLKWLMAIMLGVLFVGFLTMFATLTGILTDTWRYNVNSYIDYQESAEESAENFDVLNLKLEEISTELKHIENRFADVSKVPSPQVPSENGS